MADVDKYLAGHTATMLLDNTRAKYYLGEVRMHDCSDYTMVASFN